MPLDADIYYRYSNGESGEELPVILVHGAGGTHLHWPSQIRRLPGYKVYSIDLAGHGKSEGRGHQNIDAYRKSICRWMDKIHIYSGVFVGHSMGGAIALSMALKEPERVIALGLVGTGARLRVAQSILEHTASQTTFPLAVNEIMRRSFSRNTHPRLIETASQNMEKIRPSVLHGDFIACDTFDVMDDIHKIRQPTAVLCGQDDQLTPVRYSGYLADKIPKADLHIIPNAGHMVMLEQPQVVSDILSNFLNRLTYSPGKSYES
jgi:pimeloyl-ACP methyl ester carboxylesterase